MYFATLYLFIVFYSHFIIHCGVEFCAGNNELEWYTPSNTRISNGKLIMEARKFTTPIGSGGGASNATHSTKVRYTASKMISRGKADFGVVDTQYYLTQQHHDHDNDDKNTSHNTTALEKSRRFEARIRLPWGHGIWPAFWMLPTFDTYGG